MMTIAIVRLEYVSVVMLECVKITSTLHGKSPLLLSIEVLL